ncbi:MAG: hypothetical protein P0Y66_05870 [Candidatus Kaistia colombiensis]|nr:MAG: hypothetical protein P0Y66_05870 [Kaistia sp.]
MSTAEGHQLESVGDLAAFEDGWVCAGLMVGKQQIEHVAARLQVVNHDAEPLPQQAPGNISADEASATDDEDGFSHSRVP